MRNSISIYSQNKKYLYTIRHAEETTAVIYSFLFFIFVFMRAALFMRTFSSKPSVMPRVLQVVLCTRWLGVGCLPWEEGVPRSHSHGGVTGAAGTLLIALTN